MGERGGLKQPGPSKRTEALVAILVPPACREEVLGDLYERFRSPTQYAADVIATVPLVILSRIRRTADPQILVIQAFALSVSFLGAAWLSDRAILVEQWGLLRLAIPALMAIIGLVLEDAYARPGRRSALGLARGPMVGIGLALASQGLLRIDHPDLALPARITLYGCGMGLLLSTSVRMLFPPITGQLLGANAPALWLKRPVESDESASGATRLIRNILVIVVVAGLGTRIAAGLGSPEKVVMLLTILVVAHTVLKRD